VVRIAHGCCDLAVAKRTDFTVTASRAMVLSNPKPITMGTTTAQLLNLTFSADRCSLFA
jgi:hypothetical protein